MPNTSGCPPKAAKTEDITTSSVSSTDCCIHVHMDLRLQHSLGGSSMDTDTKMASSGISDHSGPLRRSTPDRWASVIAQIRGIPWPGGRFQGLGCICISSSLLHTIPTTILGNDSLSTSPLSHLSPTSHLQFCLSLAHELLCFFSILLTSPSHICLSW